MNMAKSQIFQAQILELKMAYISHKSATALVNLYHGRHKDLKPTSYYTKKSILY